MTNQKTLDKITAFIWILFFNFSNMGMFDNLFRGTTDRNDLEDSLNKIIPSEEMRGTRNLVHDKDTNTNLWIETQDLERGETPKRMITFDRSGVIFCQCDGTRQKVASCYAAAMMPDPDSPNPEKPDPGYGNFAKITCSKAGRARLDKLIQISPRLRTRVR